jgi:bifunctional enzyme CysN/CysC
MTEAGLVVLCSLISLFRAERQMVRELVGPGEFIEIFVDTPLEECIARDPKRAYKRALAGEIQLYRYWTSYERLESPEIHLLTARDSAEISAERVVKDLLSRNHSKPPWTFVRAFPYLRRSSLIPEAEWLRTTEYSKMRPRLRD